MTRDPFDALKRGPMVPKSHKRYRDAGALHAQYGNTDLVRFRVFADGDELWAWAGNNKDPKFGVGGKPLEEARHATIGQLVLVYDPECPMCPGELEGCHYCHAPYDEPPCPICGRGLFMTDEHGWRVNPETGNALMVARDYSPRRPYYSNPEDVEADLDVVSFHELEEHGELPKAVAMALVGWREEVQGHGLYEHRVATFLDTLADLGYGVTKIEVSDLTDLLPAPEGNQQ